MSEPYKPTRTTTYAHPSPPNIIVILADDLGYGDVGFNGPTDAQTPNLDRLAHEGIVFSNGYVASSLCSPSRAGLLTGRHPAKVGWEINAPHNPLDHHTGLDVNETLLPEYLQRTGYRTMAVGKWHLGAALPFNPLNRGFNHFYGFTGGHHDYYKVDVVSHIHGRLPMQRDSDPAGFSGYLTDALTHGAVEFIEENSHTPFFLYLSYNAPHEPLQAPPELVKKYRHVPEWKRRTYLAMVDSLDQNVGRLMESLGDLGIRDNTVVFFLSDNGGTEGIGSNSPLRGNKSSLHEGGIRVPFLASWPAGWPQGVVYEPMVSSMDIAATAMELAGVETTAHDSPLDGVNLDVYLRGQEAGVPHEALYWRGSYGVRSAAIRSGDLKLAVGARTAPHPQPRLFDLANDVEEANDIAGARESDVARLTTLWNEWNADNPVGVSGEYYSRLNAWMKNEAERRREKAESRQPYQITSE